MMINRQKFPIVGAKLAITGFVVALFAASACRSVSNVSAGQAAASNSSAPAWVTFQDPKEKAFTVEVPQGWTVHGGLFAWDSLTSGQ